MVIISLPRIIEAFAPELRWFVKMRVDRKQTYFFYGFFEMLMSN